VIWSSSWSRAGMTFYAPRSNSKPPKSRLFTCLSCILSVHLLPPKNITN
jgi:hypothetical protein